MFLGLLVASALAAPVPPSTKGSSILFLFADEMDGRIMDPASPQLKVPLPNLRKLAESGAHFAVAYNQSPQCVPSRSALMVGLRTDQIEVWDNYHGIAATNGDPDVPDSNCVKQIARGANESRAWGHAQCVALAKAQKAPPTFIDRLDTAGYNVSLFGKMHVGAGLDRFQGSIQEIPFSFMGKPREWSRGLGPSINLKGLVRFEVYFRSILGPFSASTRLLRAGNREARRRQREQLRPQVGRPGQHHCPSFQRGLCGDR